MCGCGVAFSECAFWAGVKRAFGGWSQELVAEAMSLQRGVARQRHLPRLMVPCLGSQLVHDQGRRYAEIHAKLYRAVLDESGASVAVDASKGAAQALAIAQGDQLDLRLLHLVCRARGRLFPGGRGGPPAWRGGARDDAQLSPAGHGGPMATPQAEIAAARRFVTASTLVRYEDLVAAPAPTIRTAMAALGLPVDADALTAVNGRTVDLPVSHGLSGNPSRFRAGLQQLRPR